MEENYENKASLIIDDDNLYTGDFAIDNPKGRFSFIWGIVLCVIGILFFIAV